MLRRFVAALALGFCALVSESSAVTTVYVAPGGDDRAEGSAQQPLATPAEGLRRLRGVRGTRVLQLAPGVYKTPETITLTAEDSGFAGAPLRIAGEPGNTVISGFLSLTPDRWQRVASEEDRRRIADPDVRRRIVQYEFGRAEISELGKLTRRGFDADDHREPPPAMLYLGGKRMQIARWPDAGTVTADEVIDPGPTRYAEGDAAWEDFWSRGGTFRMASRRPGSWADPRRAWVEGRFGNAWEWSFNRVANVRSGGREIELAYGEVSGIGADERRPPEFHFVNVFEELDQAGEYYIDEERGLLFFLPPEDMRDWSERVLLSSRVGPLLSIQNALNVEISGITFEGGRGAGVEVEGGRSIRFGDIHIRNCAGDGMILKGRELRVERLIAEDLGGRGILLEGGDERTLRTSGSVVVDSRFVGTGFWDPAYRPALELVGVGHQIRNCEFGDLPHMAIEVKGNDFRIEGCWFYRTCTELRDMCAIYFNLGAEPQRRGTVIRGNLFQDIGGGSDGGRGGIYLDNGTMGVTISDNVFHRVGEGSDGWAVMNHGGAYIRVHSNAFIDCPVPYHLGYWWNTWGKDELPAARERWEEILRAEETAVHRSRYPELKTFFEEDRVLPDSNTFSGNRIMNPKVSLLVTRGVSVFGGDRKLLDETGNSISGVAEGLSFDARGRPTLPGWRPWASLEIGQR